MRLLFVELEGFRGFREKVRFDLPAGFVVLTGRNGSGKSSILDAVDFALTGSVNKFAVRNARGGGLEDHIWWVGEGQPKNYCVSVGFSDDKGQNFSITRSRERDSNLSPEQIRRLLCMPGIAPETTPEAIMQTTLIRDEWIAGLSLDLPGQARFNAVRGAIGGLAGPDYSKRTAAILGTAHSRKEQEQKKLEETQSEIGRILSALTEARRDAERAADISEALRIIDSLAPNAASAPEERVQRVRSRIARMKADIRRLEDALCRQEVLEKDRGTIDEELSAAYKLLVLTTSEKIAADLKLQVALNREATERQADDLVTHWAGLLQHGEVLGLQDGHCPLCNSRLRESEFAKALLAIRTRLASRGAELDWAAHLLADARLSAESAGAKLSLVQNEVESLENRRNEVKAELESLARIFTASEGDRALGTREVILMKKERAARLEGALFVLEASSAVDRVTELESRLATLRRRAEEQAARLSGAQRVLETAKQINSSVLTVANEIMSEKFDTVMPLLKELYRRLRPHPDWKEIESDFGGKVRSTLNFSVGQGRNPQFLFSSGQRRAAGLAFLLAVHLSRPWCLWRSLLMDDPVQHIDDYRALNLIEVLTAIRRAGRQIVVAVENPALADVLCRRLRSSTGEIGRRFDLYTSETGSAKVKSKYDIFPLPKEVLRTA